MWLVVLYILIVGVIWFLWLSKKKKSFWWLFFCYYCWLSLFFIPFFLSSGRLSNNSSISLFSVIVFSTIKLRSLNSLITISELSAHVKSIWPAWEPHSLAVILNISRDFITFSGNHCFWRLPILVFRFHLVSQSSSVNFSSATLNKAAEALGDFQAISLASL